MADSTPAYLLEHAEHLLAAGDYDASAIAGARAFQAAFDSGDREMAVRGAIAAAKAHHNVEQMDEAIGWLQKVHALDRAGEWPGMLATAWVMLSSVYGAQNRVREALDALSQGMRRLDDRVSSRDKCVCFTGTGILYENLGMANAAYHNYQRAMQFAADSPDISHRFRMRRNLLDGALLLYSFYQLHRPDDARLVMQDSFHHVALLQLESARLKTPFAIASACYMAGRFSVMRGEPEQALTSIACAMGHYDSLNRIFKLDLLLAKGLALRALQRFDEAISVAAIAATMLPDDPISMLLADLRRSCIVAELSGDFARAYRFGRVLHGRVLSNAHAFVDGRISEAAAQLTHSAMQLELDELRSRNENLTGTQRDLAKLVNSDPATGLSNRRALELSFIDAQHAETPTCLMMIDIDHFKQVNDEFNHITGDQVLRRMAELLQGLVRERDCVARFGGEEFAILLHDTDIYGAQYLAQRLQRELAALDWSDVIPGRRITVSGGAVEVARGASLEDTIKNADVLLYQAKREGRNRIFLGEVETALKTVAAAPSLHMPDALPASLKPETVKRSR